MRPLPSNWTDEDVITWQRGTIAMLTADADRTMTLLTGVIAELVDGPPTRRRKALLAWSRDVALTLNTERLKIEDTLAVHGLAKGRDDLSGS